MRFSNFILLLCIGLLPAHGLAQTPELLPAEVHASPAMQEYQSMELIGFVHFTVNTFTDKEWGYGDEDPSIFNPTDLDVEQWARVASDAGMKQLILTAKHHDGFCLWPSKYTRHSVKNSPYKFGKGDIVREFVDACRKYDLKVGLYLSPWDRNHKDYGKKAYLEYYRNQLIELLTEYGPINEIWFDGANGGDGFYGGKNEKRFIDRKTYYEWDSTFRLVKKLQPNIKIFSDAGPDVHWIGNENGIAGETFWTPIRPDSLVIGESDTGYLNTGDPKGTKWMVGQCDVSIRPGWFYHASEDDKVKTPQQLMDLYFKSVGRNGLLLLNIPPDRRGKFHENDVKSLLEFARLRKQAFDVNLAPKARPKSSVEGLAEGALRRVIDGDASTYWAATDTRAGVASLILTWGQPVTFNTVSLQEPILYGQRISKFRISAYEKGKWVTVQDASTIGYKRLLQFPAVTALALRVDVLESVNMPAIAEIGVYLSEMVP